MPDVIEYEVLWIKAKGETELKDHFNNMGKDGWILATLIPTPEIQADTFVAVFYRKKT